MLQKPVKLCKTCLKEERHQGRTECYSCIMKNEKEKKIIRKQKEVVRKNRITEKKRLSRSNLIKEADRVWSIYIRERDRGNPCITCGVQWEENHQAGHFQSRRHLNTRWLTINGASQCPKCNCWGAGEQYEFALALEKKSPGLPEAIRRLALSTDKVTDEEILAYIKGLYHELSELAVDFKPKKYISG